MTEPPAATPKRPRRWGLLIPVAILAIAILGWFVYWTMLKGEAETRIQAFLAAERARGAEASADIARIWGFPRELAIELENVVYAPPDRAWRMTAPHVRLNVNPANPRHTILEFDTPVSFAFRDHPTTTLSGTNIRASLRYSADALAEAALSGGDIVYADPAPEGREFRAQALSLNLRPAPNAPEEAQASLDITRLQLERPVEAFEPLGNVVQNLELRVVLTHAGALATAQRHPLDAWREAEGAARLVGGRLRWGALNLTARGEASLDETRRPVGRVTLIVEAAPAALRALAADAMLSAEDGVLRLGETPLRTLPPLY